jgi:hypothetical protein
MALPRSKYVLESTAYAIWKELGGQISSDEWDQMCKDGPLVLHVLYAEFIIYTRWMDGRRWLPIENFTAAVNALIDDVEDDALVEEKKKLLARVRELDGIEKEKDKFMEMSREPAANVRKSVASKLRSAFISLQGARLSLRLLSEEDKKIARDRIDETIMILEATLVDLVRDL